MRYFIDPKKNKIPEKFVRNIFSKYKCVEPLDETKFLNNLIQGKKAYQSSKGLPRVGLIIPNEDEFHSADLATDGHIDQTCRYTISSTKIEKDPWWEVDLGDQKLISSVVAWLPLSSDETEEKKKEEMSFPLEILCSDKPFPKEGGLEAARKTALFSKRFEQVKGNEVVTSEPCRDSEEFDVIHFSNPIGIYTGCGFALDISQFSKQFSSGDYIVFHADHEKPSTQKAHQYVSQSQIEGGLWFPATSVPRTSGSYKLTYMSKAHKIIASSPIFQTLTCDNSKSKWIGPIGNMTTSGSFNDGSVRPVTKIRINADQNRIFGIETWYGGVSGGFHGATNGTDTVVELDRGDYFNYCRLYASNSYILTIELKSNRGQQILCGLKTKMPPNSYGYQEKISDFGPNFRMCSCKGSVVTVNFYNLGFKFVHEDQLTPKDLPIISKLTDYELMDSYADLGEPILTYRGTIPLEEDMVETKCITNVKGAWPGESLRDRPEVILIDMHRKEKDDFSFAAYQEPIYVYLVFPEKVMLPVWAVELGFKKSNCELSLGEWDDVDEVPEKEETYKVYYAGPFPPGYEIKLKGPSVENIEMNKKMIELKSKEKKEPKDEEKRFWADNYGVLVAKANTDDSKPSSISLVSPISIEEKKLKPSSLGLTLEMMLKFDIVPQAKDNKFAPVTLFKSSDSNWELKLTGKGEVIYNIEKKSPFNLGKLGLDSGKWVHIAVVTTKKVVKLYRNGKLKNQLKFAASSTTWECPSFTLGGRAMKGEKDGKNLSGMLASEFRIWGTERSSEEIKTLMRDSIL